MTRTIAWGFLLLILGASTASAQQQESNESFAFYDDQQTVDELFRLALIESSAYDWLGHLCLEIGHRLSGSPQAEKAVDYSLQLMQEMQLNAFKQAVMVPVWRRGKEDLAFYTTSSGYQEELNILALGGSVPTDDDGLFAEVVEVKDWADLAALGKEGIEGKIVFFNEEMPAENIYTFHSYGHCVKHRWGGAVEAAKYGAVGVLVRSLNMRIDDFPHTGSMKYEDGITKIPAAAVSTLDAESIHKALANGETVKALMRLQCETLPDQESYNVIGEIKGSEFPEEIILVGGHLDSWDVGHGAHDDGAGVMQSLGALELLQKLGYRPRRTLRVVFFMNEENGLRGATTYAEVSKQNNWSHIAAIESDRGGFTPRGFHVEGSAEQLLKIQSWEAVLEKFGIHQVEEGGSGADIGPLKTDDNVLIGFVPDSQRYFDHHHSANDTFDTVNKRELELGTASIAALIYFIDKYGI